MCDVNSREFETLNRRVEQIDAQGSRGVAALAIQLSDARQDILDLKAEFKSHEQVHEREREQARLDRLATDRDRVTAERDRRKTRRWLITGVVLPSLALIASALTVVITLH